MDDSLKRDLRAGVALDELAEGKMVTGQIDGEDALVLCQSGNLFAIGELCTHYHARLTEGLLDGTTLRCPMHHARFDIRTGKALCAPALDALPCWHVRSEGDRVFVGERIVVLPAPRLTTALHDVVIVGAGAAGLAAAEMLRRRGYDGSLTMISADSDAPCDRPNLSKDFLAGNAPADWMPLRPEGWYAQQRIELRLNTRVAAIDVARSELHLADGAVRTYGALLLATGADPVQLTIPGATPGQVHTLRSFSDGRAIVAQAASAHSALVIGSSFIGLEVAASLRSRGIDVHVVAPEALPMQRVLGPELGRFVHELHASKGVKFHLGTTVTRLDGRRARLADGKTIDVDLVIAGVGVRPTTALFETAGLAIDRGVSVDEYLQTTATGIFAAGDIARWPDPHSGERIRVEHWAVAQRQGQVAALNMLGLRQRFDAVPFFWSLHYDVAIQYVGHAEHWDAVEIDGSLEARDCTVRYLAGTRTLAVVTIGRDIASLRAEQALEALCAPQSRLESSLDEALAMTFPASDPVAVDPPAHLSQPPSPPPAA
jgi:NADPH-dependent 2,4-dienoyl-CoA reductase/sulfur reductase-like enzyme/nitrite reductase/ring-hydroxylating ferredoxin subunit